MSSPLFFSVLATLPTRSPPMTRFSRTVFFAILLLTCFSIGFARGAMAADGSAPSSWPQFRGQASAGYVPSGQIPSTWSDADYAWRRELPSRDVGSPVIADGKVFYLVSRPEQSEIAVEAVDLLTGSLLWSNAYPQKDYRTHPRNTRASSTPTVDGEYVFVAWSDPDQTILKCLDLQGHEIWSRDFGSWQSQHGFGTSPRVFGSMVLLFNSQQAEQLNPGETPGRCRMIAVDRATGDLLWETELEATRTSYGVPAIYQPEDGRGPQIVNANTGNGLFGLDAESGKMLWNLKVFTMRCCSTPQIIDDIAIGSAGSGRGGNHMVAVRIPKAGQEPEEVYRIERRAPYVPTPVIKDKMLFMVDDNGIASCIDAKTGEEKWQRRAVGTTGASPVIIGDKLLLIDLDGKAVVLRASDQYEKLGEVDLGGYVGATPAFAEGRLLLRVDSELRCLAPGSI